MNYAGNYVGAEKIASAPETPLNSTIAELESYLNDMGMASELLHKRLSESVLCPDNVTAIDVPKQLPQPTRVQMSATAERVFAITQRVRNITAQMQNALDRLEA